MNNKHVTLFSIFVIIFLLFSVVSISQATVEQTKSKEISVKGPRGDLPLFQWIKSSFVPIMFGMRNANFSSGDVLFSEFSTFDTFSRVLKPHFSNVSRTLDLTSFKEKVSTYLGQNKTIFSTLIKNLLSDLLSEIGNNTELSMTKYTLFSPLKEVNQRSRFVLILWDPDKSVINSIDTIRNNQTPSNQPFTGDEVITSVRMDRIVDNIYGRFVEKSQFSYGNGSIASKMAQLSSIFNSKPILAKTLIRALNLTDILSIRHYDGSLDGIDKTVSKLNSEKNVNLGFTVSQLQINNLTLGKRLNNVIVNNFDATLVEHNALGLTIFNDTNSNGIMDLEMQAINSDRPGLNQTILPKGSEEALFRVDFKNAGQSIYTPLSKTDNVDELSFSFSASNLSVDLNPISRNLDESIFGNPSELQQTIDEFGFTFHFSPNATSSKAVLKFDWMLGEWSNKTALEGLSLNKMIVTGISDFSGRQRIMKLAPEEKKDFIPSEKSSKSKRIAITVGQAPLAEVELDEIPYIVGGTTEAFANGQTLPLLFVNLLFGKITSHSDVLRTIGGSVSSQRYLYSLSYPTFGGESILHDPTFAMVPGTTTDGSSGTSQSTDGVFGFELISIIILPLIIIGRRKK